MTVSAASWPDPALPESGGFLPDNSGLGRAFVASLLVHLILAGLILALTGSVTGIPPSGRLEAHLQPRRESSPKLPTQPDSVLTAPSKDSTHDLREPPQPPTSKATVANTQETSPIHQKLDPLGVPFPEKPGLVPIPHYRMPWQVQRPPMLSGNLHAIAPTGGGDRVGKVVVRLLIDNQGHIAEASVLYADLETDFQVAALNALRNTTFTAGYIAGTTANTQIAAIVRFGGSHRGSIQVLSTAEAIEDALNKR